MTGARLFLVKTLRNLPTKCTPAEASPFVSLTLGRKNTKGSCCPVRNVKTSIGKLLTPNRIRGALGDLPIRASTNDICPRGERSDRKLKALILLLYSSFAAVNAARFPEVGLAL